MSLFIVCKHQTNCLWKRINTDNSSLLDIYINLQAWYLGLLTIHPVPSHFAFQYLWSFSSPSISPVS